MFAFKYIYFKKETLYHCEIARWMEVFPNINRNITTFVHLPPRIIAVTPALPPRVPSFGKHKPSLRGQGSSPGLTGTSRLFPLTEPKVQGTHPDSAHPSPTSSGRPSPPAARFLSKQTLKGGDRGAQAERRGNLGNKPQTHAAGPARPHRGSVRPSRPGRGPQARRVPPPGARTDGGKPLAARSLARAQRDGNSAKQPRPRRSPRPPWHTPRSHAGRRFEVKQGGWGEQEARLPRPRRRRPRTEFRGGAGEALGLPWGEVSPSAGPGPSPQSRRHAPPGWIRTGSRAETGGGESDWASPGRGMG